MRYESELVKPIKVHGGKFYLASSIVKLFPERCACPNSPSPSDPGYIHYVEPYAGGLSVLLNNEPEGISEVVNDLNHEITNFWRVLQDETLFSEFIRKVEAVPFSEVEYGSSVRFGYEETKANPVAAAVSLFIRSRQSLAGRMKRFTGVTRSRTRRGMNAECSAWLSAVEGLPEVHARLKRILVFNRDALDVIRSEDGARVLQYLDPPYLHSTRATTTEYGEYEMTEGQHKELLDTLVGIRGRFLLSGYRSDLYDEYESKHGWRSVEFHVANSAAGGSNKRIMTEVVWMNYQPDESEEQSEEQEEEQEEQGEDL